MPDLEKVLREHGGSLGRVAASYAPPGPDREDLRQEIALALVSALPRFRGDSSLRTYVLRIAHNCGIRYAVARRRNSMEASDQAVELQTPEAAAAARQDAERLATAIRTLPIGLRQVLVLRLEDLSHREIADMLGTTDNAVTVRLHRARTALRQCMVRGNEDGQGS